MALDAFNECGYGAKLSLSGPFVKNVSLSAIECFQSCEFVDIRAIRCYPGASKILSEEVVVLFGQGRCFEEVLDAEIRTNVRDDLPAVDKVLFFLHCQRIIVRL